MKFYNLYDDEKYPLASELGIYEQVRCEKEEGHLRAGDRVGDLIIELPISRIGDFVWTWTSYCMITDKVAKLFEEAKFTGYELRPVKIKKLAKSSKQKYIVDDEGFILMRGVRKKLIPIPRLWELVVVGKGGEADPRTGIRLKYECKYCGLKVYTSFSKGLYFDESKWDGSDFFIIWPLPKFIIVTERVKDFCEEKGLTNCTFTPIEELISEGEDGELSPGELPPWW